MRFVLNTKYSETELDFVKKHNCEIISEIKLSRCKVMEHEIPHRMLKYGSAYIAEIYDEDRKELVWSVLSKRKGVYHFSTIYENLDTLEQNF